MVSYLMSDFGVERTEDDAKLNTGGVDLFFLFPSSLVFTLLLFIFRRLLFGFWPTAAGGTRETSVKGGGTFWSF